MFSDAWRDTLIYTDARDRQERTRNIRSLVSCACVCGAERKTVGSFTRQSRLDSSRRRRRRRNAFVVLGLAIINRCPWRWWWRYGARNVFQECAPAIRSAWLCSRPLPPSVAFSVPRVNCVQRSISCLTFAPRGSEWRQVSFYNGEFVSVLALYLSDNQNTATLKTEVTLVYNSIYYIRIMNKPLNHYLVYSSDKCGIFLKQRDLIN